MAKDGFSATNLVHSLTDQNILHIVDCAFDAKGELFTILTTNKHIAQFRYENRNHDKTRPLANPLFQEAEFLLEHQFYGMFHLPNCKFFEHEQLLQIAAGTQSGR